MQHQSRMLLKNKVSANQRTLECPMTFVGSNHAMARSPRPAHDGAVDWSLELGALFQINGALNAWDDETTMAVTTWYVHHDRRPICNRPRHLQLLGNPITWIYDLRRAWEEFWTDDCHLLSIPSSPDPRNSGNVEVLVISFLNKRKSRIRQWRSLQP